MSEKGPSYSFFVEWYDSVASLVKKYRLVFHSGINSVEMHDEKQNRLFLKCTKVESLKLSDFYLGGSITVLSRTLKIVDYGDKFTKEALVGKTQRCLVFIRPAAVCNAGKILQSLEDRGFRVVNLKLICPSVDEVRNLLGTSMDHSVYPKLLSELSGQRFMAVELMREDAVAQLYEVIYGTSASTHDPLSNPDMMVLSHDATVASEQANQIFGFPGGPHFHGAPQLKGTTLAVIKPHAVTSGNLGMLWSAIRNQGFCIISGRLFRLSKIDAADFLEVYKGVVHEYPEMLEQLSCGPCVALEIGNTNQDSSVSVQQAFRECVGPSDPEIARFLRPDTLRAKFGIDKVRNALHCTDLPEDGQLEVNFFFQHMDK